jgi:hypothetical protein
MQIGDTIRMKALVTMCCMLAAIFVSPANVLIAAPAERACSTAELVAAIERESGLQTIVRPDWTTRVQSDPQSGFQGAQSAAAPTIVDLFPTAGPVGTWVTIRGAGLTSNNFIQFRGQFRGAQDFRAGSPVGSENGTSLRFQVTTCPSGEPQCPGFHPSPGAYKVTVMNENGESNETTFFLTSH